jgi:HD-GYP domain-containing protein (c-di-GMP phosphodiesterase class II)
MEQASFERLIDIGIALSSEKNPDRLMETILLEAKNIGSADAGTLYIRTRDDTLQFEIVRNDTLGTAAGGTTGVPVEVPAVPMFKDGDPNYQNMVAYAANTGETINIEDAYEAEGFDFSGPKNYDKQTGYRTRSVLTVPLKNRAGEVIGVFQLLNAKRPDTDENAEFDLSALPLIEALASQAAVALENQNLLDTQKQLLDSFIELMASAVDAKSPYTGGHCQRVPDLTEMLAQAACEVSSGPFAGFDLDDDEWYELHIGAWLHDCGKVTTPEFVVDKATRLETIYDRIHEIRTRFEVVKREAEIDCLNKIIAGGDEATLRGQLTDTLAAIDDDFAFIAECNQGGEFMQESAIERVHEIAKRQWLQTLNDRLGCAREELSRKECEPETPLPTLHPLLADRPDHILAHHLVPKSADPNNPYGFQVNVPEHMYNRGEIYNLCIPGRGTLTEEERFKINDHIVQTIMMLEELPFPKNLENVPEIAGGHHEKMDGTGYPKKLMGGTMSVPARIMAIADVFEALTAADRPYKAPKTLSDSIRIMSFMVKDQHLDGDLFRLFLSSGVFLEYADKYLMTAQIDEVNIGDYGG